MARLLHFAAGLLVFTIVGCTPDPTPPATEGSTMPLPPSVNLDEGKQQLADAIAAAQQSLEPAVPADRWQTRGGVGDIGCGTGETIEHRSDQVGTDYELVPEDLESMTAAVADHGFTPAPGATIVPGTLSKVVFTTPDGFELSVLSGDGRGTRMSGKTPCLARNAAGAEGVREP